MGFVICEEQVDVLPSWAVYVDDFNCALSSLYLDAVDEVLLLGVAFRF